MTVLDRRMDRRNAVLEYSSYVTRGQCRLLVDQSHPFFFDHPLDHVPGLLLLEAAVQAAQDRAEFPCFVGAVRAKFHKYAYFDAPIWVEVTHRAEGTQLCCNVKILQGNHLRAEIEVDLRPETALQPAASPAPLQPPPPTRASACPGDLLNKLRPENVLIDRPQTGTDNIRAHLLPMDRDCLFGDGFGAVPPLYLLEAFMQVQRYLNATQDGDQRIRDILTGVSIDLSRPLAQVQGVAIEGDKAFYPKGRSRMARRAKFSAAGQIFGQCEIETARLCSRATPAKT